MPVQGRESRMTYCRDLAGAAFSGFTSVWPQAYAASAPAAIGAAAGALSAAWMTRRRSRSYGVAASLVGTLVGCGAAMAWTSRSAIVPALRLAGKRVNSVRDAYWLADHPIDYA
jgi:ABC-type xylose transport system permease subunit